VKKSSRILPRVWLILFGVWKPIKRENSEFLLPVHRTRRRKNNFFSLFSISFRHTTMSSSSSSLSEKKKPPPVVDSDAAAPTQSAPASIDPTTKPKKKRVLKPRAAQDVPRYGAVPVTDKKPDCTEVSVTKQFGTEQKK
jgi:hypothetical protein